MVLVFGLLPYAAALLSCWALTHWLVKRKTIRYALNIAALVCIWLVLFGDTIFLRYQFHQLCKKDAGIEIYQKIPRSIADFTDSLGEVDWQAVEDNFRVDRTSKRITKERGLDTQLLEFYYDDNLVGSIRYYNYRSGAFLRGIASGGITCPKKSIVKEFYSKIFNGDK
ncbi:MAG: hypothetical protein H6992_02725 [Pseudomonadales bacterium]|nr:hypothetical protein [Pseudomonadales bacterium]